MPSTRKAVNSKSQLVNNIILEKCQMMHWGLKYIKYEKENLEP